MFGARFYGPRYFGDGGDAAPPAPTGQVPRATRNRLGHRVNYVHRAVWIVLSLGGLV